MSAGVAACAHFGVILARPLGGGMRLGLQDLSEVTRDLRADRGEHQIATTVIDGGRRPSTELATEVVSERVLRGGSILVSRASRLC